METIPNQSNNDHIDSASLAVWYQAILNRFNSTTNANNAIDNKSSVVLAAAVAIAVFVAERLADGFGVLGLLALLGFITASIIILINTNLNSVPGEVNSTDDRPGYYGTDDHSFMWHLISDLEASLLVTQGINNKKANYYKVATIFFAIASAILLVSIFWDFSIPIQSITRIN